MINGTINDSPSRRQPLVSIIIPSYNYDKFIGHTLDSLRNQTYRNWECIVVDDGSKDNTAGVLESYQAMDERIQYIYQSHGGPCRARNNGISRSRGEYFQFLDADDLLESRKIECHLDYLERNMDVDLVYGSARYFRTEYPDERRYSMAAVDKQWMPNVSGCGNDVLEALIRHNIMVVSAPLIRKHVIEKIG